MNQVTLDRTYGFILLSLAICTFVVVYTPIGAWLKFYLSPTKERRIARLQRKIEIMRWTVLLDLRKHDRLAPRIGRMTNKLHSLGGKRLDEV